MNNGNRITTFAKNELTRNNLFSCPFGDILFKFITDMCDVTNGEKIIVNGMIETLYKIFNEIPISPITEEDFDGCEPDSLGCVRCSRYHWLIKSPNGEYWDERYLTYIDSVGNMMWDKSSIKQVSLPYVPMINYASLEKTNP